MQEAAKKEHSEPRLAHWLFLISHKQQFLHYLAGIPNLQILARLAK